MSETQEVKSRESEMRAADVPWFKTPEELIDYINGLVNEQHDYGTCVYAMSMAAVAAFQYVAGVLGTTGFQASCADLDVVRRTRHLKGPFILLKGEDALYPQYNLHGRLSEALASWRPWLKEEAGKLLVESPNAHHEVVAHWQRLAEEVQ